MWEKKKSGIGEGREMTTRLQREFDMPTERDEKARRGFIQGSDEKRRSSRGI